MSNALHAVGKRRRQPLTEPRQSSAGASSRSSGVFTFRKARNRESKGRISSYKTGRGPHCLHKNPITLRRPVRELHLDGRQAGPPIDGVEWFPFKPARSGARRKRHDRIKGRGQICHVAQEGSVDEGHVAATATTRSQVAASSPAWRPASGPPSGKRSGASRAGTGKVETRPANRSGVLVQKINSRASGSTRRATRSTRGKPPNSIQNLVLPHTGACAPSQNQRGEPDLRFVHRG